MVEKNLQLTEPHLTAGSLQEDAVSESAAVVRAVVIGGGTGAPVSIRALLDLGVSTSAVVAMADDGGSSGLLREHTGAVPPGDVRKCIVAMAKDPASPLARAFKYRFDYLYNHTLGNLILTALTDTTGSFPEAVALCERLLEARGHVYPSTLESVVLTGITRDGRHITGQATICTSDTALEAVSLIPANPEPYQPALTALRNADLIVLGPGSLFTSIIPNLLVPGVIEAIRDSRAKTVFLCSLADMQGETWGLNAAEHVEALLDHGMRDRLDVVVVHQSASPADSIRRVSFDDRLAQRIQQQGPLLMVRDLVDPLRPTWHDVQALSDVLEGVLSACPSPQKSKTSSHA